MIQTGPGARLYWIMSNWTWTVDYFSDWFIMNSFVKDYIYLRQTTTECSSPHSMITTGSLRMKKCDAMLSANLLRPSVNTAPVSTMCKDRYIVILTRNVNMRVRESIRAVGEIARRELPINLRRAHCLQLLFAFSLAFDPRHYSKWQACRISPFVANLSAHNKNTCRQEL